MSFGRGTLREAPGGGIGSHINFAIAGCVRFLDTKQLPSDVQQCQQAHDGCGADAHVASRVVLFSVIAALGAWRHLLACVLANVLAGGGVIAGVGRRGCVEGGELVREVAGETGSGWCVPTAACNGGPERKGRRWGWRRGGRDLRFRCRSGRDRFRLWDFRGGSTGGGGRHHSGRFGGWGIGDGGGRGYILLCRSVRGCWKIFINGRRGVIDSCCFGGVFFNGRHVTGW